MSELINLRINLTKIPKERIYTNPTTGEKSIDITAATNFEGLDKFGNTHSAWIRQTKEESEAKAKKIYVGNGVNYALKKELEANQQAPSQQAQPAPKPKKEEEDDNLPF